MPMERYEFMSNVWKDGIFGTSAIVVRNGDSSGFIT
jgi:hypothetical protein